MSGRDGRTRLDDHLQRLILLEQIIESILCVFLIRMGPATS